MSRPGPQDPDLVELAARLRQLSGLTGKTDIQSPAATFPHQPFPALGPAAALGDDAALLPAVATPLLLASEGLDPALVAADPWFAGWCGVLVNLSDIAAMGGTPIAVVNSLWCRSASRAEPILAGLRRASEVFGVPVVGGHTNLHSPYDALAVAVLGTAAGPVLSARAARPGDHCHLLIDPNGGFRGDSLCWDAATEADPARLRRQLALMAALAADGSVHAAKDISMGGLVGTAAMVCEAAGCGLTLDLGAIQPPAGVALEPWLTCFPSFGFLLAARPDQEGRLAERVAACGGLLLARIGTFTAERRLVLAAGGQQQEIWRGEAPLTGFGALP
ncbi:sll0787 family AIR synthase-like protein [Aphanothece minutissima]|uniref:Sll0787 family AIR synthase-like protein n=1 Tax=Aphanothece cf. minutissima CCALA 015 TaxID=2107695 RepID=A0ABX5F7D9_9CHRO|nr:sll0787 family AIR synthase-like protein [Aphanothece minutissima]PSB37522.1 sll0787 family AIR synthase-like protein [Aphanothece cf. minutissima CCALA 015]